MFYGWQSNVFQVLVLIDKKEYQFNKSLSSISNEISAISERFSGVSTSKIKWKYCPRKNKKR
jgi:hypothetical protein